MGEVGVHEKLTFHIPDSLLAPTLPAGIIAASPGFRVSTRSGGEEQCLVCWQGQGSRMCLSDGKVMLDIDTRVLPVPLPPGNPWRGEGMPDTQDHTRRRILTSVLKSWGKHVGACFSIVVRLCCALLASTRPEVLESVRWCLLFNLSGPKLSPKQFGWLYLFSCSLLNGFISRRFNPPPLHFLSGIESEINHYGLACPGVVEIARESGQFRTSETASGCTQLPQSGKPKKSPSPPQFTEPQRQKSSEKYNRTSLGIVKNEVEGLGIFLDIGLDHVGGGARENHGTV